MVTRNGRPAKKAAAPTPTSIPTTKSMITNKSSDSKNETLNLLRLRNTINRYRISAKAPESMQVTEISWNQKGTIRLYTCSGFQNLDLDLHQGTTTDAVQHAGLFNPHVYRQEILRIQAYKLPNQVTKETERKRDTGQTPM